ncbi:PH domain-containing protein [Chryseobacterium sp. Tr-659]|uniref:PH domain-containing protein n=1 Tax=Chryseobacterium sp. Tr-659 TaxID=2608340 RepID=UPI0014212110|nr:PH domain-containing protein [Chryseobacterium sp. Tr-659]
MDILLGENKLSDGDALCNKCLDVLSNINEKVLYKLNEFSIADIKSLLQTQKISPVQKVEKTEQNLPALSESELGSISKEVYKRRHQKIKYELEKLNANLSIFTRGEIKELPYLISEDEKILAITDAQFVNTLDAGVLVVTPQRMLSASKSMFGTAKINDYSNESIKAVSFVPDSKSPIIKLHLEERVVEFECYMDKEDAEKFYDKISVIYNNTEVQIQKQPNIINKISSEAVFEQLEKLGNLRERGILTDTEFTEQKKKLLEQLQ